MDPSTHGHGEISENEETRAPKSTISSPDEKEQILTQIATADDKNNDSSIKATTTREDGKEYPSGPKLGLIVLALCLSVFLVALGMSLCFVLCLELLGLRSDLTNMGIDNSIIATAIPKITDQFHSLGDVGWYGSGTSTCNELELNTN